MIIGSSVVKGFGTSDGGTNFQGYAQRLGDALINVYGMTAVHYISVSGSDTAGFLDRANLVRGTELWDLLTNGLKDRDCVCAAHGEGACGAISFGGKSNDANSWVCKGGDANCCASSYFDGKPRFVWIGLSLGNEGLRDTTDSAGSLGVRSLFEANTKLLVEQIGRYGVPTVVAGVYSGGFNSHQTQATFDTDDFLSATVGTWFPGAVYARMLHDVSHCYPASPTSTPEAGLDRAIPECGMWLGCAACSGRTDASDYERVKTDGSADTLHANRNGAIAMYRALDLSAVVEPFLCDATATTLSAAVYSLVGAGTCGGAALATYGGDDANDDDWELSGNEHACRAKCSLVSSCSGYELSLQSRGAYSLGGQSGPAVAATGAAARRGLLFNTVPLRASGSDTDTHAC